MNKWQDCFLRYLKWEFDIAEENSFARAGPASTMEDTDPLMICDDPKLKQDEVPTIHWRQRFIPKCTYG